MPNLPLVLFSNRIFFKDITESPVHLQIFLSSLCDSLTWAFNLLLGSINFYAMQSNRVYHFLKNVRQYKVLNIRKGKIWGYFILTSSRKTFDSSEWLNISFTGKFARKSTSQGHWLMIWLYVLSSIFNVSELLSFLRQHLAREMT